MTDASSARPEILARIRSANGKHPAALSPDADWNTIPRNYRQTTSLGRVECIDLFIERLRDYGATVDRCPPGEIAIQIAQILRSRNKKRMLVSPDIESAWLIQSEIAFVTDGALSHEEIDDCDGVLTGCAVAIATTGTLGLCHGKTGKTQGRRALTLIPDYHLCIVRASEIVETVPEAMRALDRSKSQPITLISGPSATSDIEMTRIQGVHGPRVLDVVIAVESNLATIIHSE